MMVSVYVVLTEVPQMRAIVYWNVPVYHTNGTTVQTLTEYR